MRTNNCDKRCYPSKHAAREANANNGHSLRAYYHRACGAYHVTKTTVRQSLKRHNKPLVED